MIYLKEKAEQGFFFFLEVGLWHDILKMHISISHVL